jgi:putative ABC transport system permease protein
LQAKLQFPAAAPVFRMAILIAEAQGFGMLIWTIIKVAYRSIAANKMRSFLTMLGVIIGVAAVIAMLALGAGTKEKVTESVKGMGSNLLVVRPEWRRGGGVTGGGARRDLTLEDAEQVLAQVQEVEMVSPEVQSRFQAKFMNKNTQTSVLGEPPTYFPVRNFEIAHGRAFTESEVDQAAKVAVLGSKVAEDLFGEMDPVGEQVKIKGINFRVIGVTKTKGDQGWYNPDDQIVVPLNTAMNQLAGQTNIDSIYLTVRDGVDMADATEKVSAVLRKQHRLQVGAPDDFSVRNLQEIADSLEEVSRVFTLLLSGVASISLLVGGIGIMNIMLVTVTERTREIGIRKALGARNRDLMTQFLLEAIVVSLTGGILGITFGIGTILLFNYVMSTYYGGQFSAQIQLWPVLLAFGFSFAVGVFFGWYPARKAARLDPIDALRYE